VSYVIGKLPEKYFLYANVGFLAFQSIHLLWLATNYLFPSIFGVTPWAIFEDRNVEVILSIVDFIEVPFLMFNVIYFGLRLLRKKTDKMLIVTTAIVLLQFVHIFWLTDEVIMENGSLPKVFAVFSILIDYLEIQTMYVSIKRIGEIGGRKN
jgi:hypothetical protein